MGEYINRKTVIDPETGEIIKENNWVGYDGFNEKGYKYRNKAIHIPSNIAGDGMANWWVKMGTVQ